MQGNYLSAIFVYPLKSARGISLLKSATTSRGLVNDRRWMLADAGGKFISQRQFPRLAKISVALDDRTLQCAAPGMPHFTISPEILPQQERMVQIWNDTIPAQDAGEESHHWFTKFLGVEAYLVYMGELSRREVNHKNIQAPRLVSFADAFPYLLTSTASLDDLNSRLRRHIPMDRFRPNLVVAGTDPYAEDRWKRIRIGSVIFRLVKPCSRCVVTTVDQKKGISGKEPLLTLSRYRNFDGKVYFGQNLIHETAGEIEVGQKVEVLE